MQKSFTIFVGVSKNFDEKYIFWFHILQFLIPSIRKIINNCITFKIFVKPFFFI